MATIQDATFSANSTLEVPGECRCLLSSDNVNDSMIINPTSALTGRESIYHLLDTWKLLQKKLEKKTIPFEGPASFQAVSFFVYFKHT